MLRTAFVLGGLLAIGAAPPGPKPPGPPPLPPLNAKVEAFARENLGRPVGDGICITLAEEALRKAGAKVFPYSDPDGDYTWGEPVGDLKDALPGDVLQFRDAVFDGRRKVGRRVETWHQVYPHHTAIVARVEQAGKVVVIYHQNVELAGQAPDQKRKVQETALRMDSLQKGGWIKVYRPIPADPPRRSFVEDGPDR